MFKISLITDRGSFILRQRLIRCGYQVKCIELDTPRTDEAVNLEVIKWIEQEQPDLIIVDESTFYPAIPQLKNNLKTQSIPVLIIISPGYFKFLKDIKSDDYLIKPLNFLVLITKVEILLKQKPTRQLILELIQANPQGLTFDEIDQRIDRGIIKLTLEFLVKFGRIRTKEQEGQFIYYPVQHKQTIELILELLQANPQGLTIDEIKNKIIRRRPINFYLKILVDSRRIKTKEQEGELIYYPVQK